MTETQILYVVLAVVAVFDVLWVGVPFARSVRNRRAIIRVLRASAKEGRETFGSRLRHEYPLDVIAGDLVLGARVRCIGVEGWAYHGREGYVYRRELEQGRLWITVRLGTAPGAELIRVVASVVELVAEGPGDPVSIPNDLTERHYVDMSPGPDDLGAQVTRAYTREGVTVQEPPGLPVPRSRSRANDV